MKENILKLRAVGKSYRQIKKELGCSMSTISFHCGEGQKEKNNARRRKYRSKNYLLTKVYSFTNRKIKVASRDFQRREIGKRKVVAVNKINPFGYLSVLKKFGENTTCYLSGIPINLLKDNFYCLDHVIPVKCGGKNTLKNMGILHKEINRMKGELSIEDFVEWCIKVVKYNGYKIEKCEIIRKIAG